MKLKFEDYVFQSRRLDDYSGTDEHTQRFSCKGHQRKLSVFLMALIYRINTCHRLNLTYAMHLWLVKFCLRCKTHHGFSRGKAGFGSGSNSPAAILAFLLRIASFMTSTSSSETVVGSGSGRPACMHTQNI